jgi:hypothetical protein
VLDGQDRARRQAYRFLGHAAQEHVLEAGAPVGAHDDEIRAPLLGDADDGVGRLSHGGLDFPRALEGIRDEVAELIA